MLRTIIFTVLVFLSTSIIVSAQETDRDSAEVVVRPFKKVRPYLGIRLGVSNINRNTETTEPLSKSAFTIGFEAGAQFFDWLDLQMAVSGILPSDDGSFTQFTQPINGGPITNSESTTELTKLDFAFGLRSPYLILNKSENAKQKAISIFTHLGTSSISGNRAIRDCTDCNTEKMELTNGGFYDIGIDLLFPGQNKGNGHLLLTYRNFNADTTIKSEITLTGRYSF